MYVLILALLLALQAAPSPSPAPPLQARFIGQMAFSITDGSTTLITDFPYQIGYAGAPAFDDRELQHTSDATLALITHRHLDHFEPSLFGKTSWKLLAPPDVMARIRNDRLVPLTSRVSFASMTIEPIRTPHHDLEHYSYIVTWHGKRLYFSGDTESADSLLAARNLDAAFVSPWQYQAARRSGKPIDATRIVIYHHALGQQVPGCDVPCRVPRQGEVISIP